MEKAVQLAFLVANMLLICGLLFWIKFMAIALGDLSAISKSLETLAQESRERMTGVTATKHKERARGEK